MIEILPAPDHVSAFRLDGHLTGDDYDRMITDVEARLGRHRRIAVYCDAATFTDIGPDALIKDFAYALGHLGDWPRYAQMALVTDKGWMRLAVKAVAPLVPAMEVRVFAPGEQAEALAWISRPLARAS